MTAGDGAATRRPRLQLAAGGLVLLCLLGALVVSRLGGVVAFDWSRAATEWARSAGPFGWLLFGLAQTVVAMVGIVPASLMGIAAGGVYGLPVGFAVAAAGTLIGGWLSFALARSLLRPVVQRVLARRVNSRLLRLDAAVARDGWRFVCLLRVSPVMPFALTSYALGLTEITRRDYLLGTLASLPALAGYVAVGALAQYGLRSAAGGVQTGPFGWALLAIGAVATLLLILRSGTLLARCGLLPGKSLSPRPLRGGEGL